MKFKRLVEDILNEKIILYNDGANYGQVVFFAGGAGCFTEDTLVETETGHKQISDLEIGDNVFTYNEVSGEKELNSVQEVFQYQLGELPNDQDIIELKFDNGTTIECTEEHEFFVDGEWVTAKNLEVSKKYKKAPNDTNVFDISVEGNANYYVSNQNILVHNSGKGFAIKNFIQGGKFKIIDVDKWKEAYLELQELTNKFPELQGLDLQDPDDVAKLHMFVKRRDVRAKTINNILGAADPRRLPNLLFDVTLKDIRKITDIMPQLQSVGYDSEDIHITWVLTDYSIAVKRNRDRERIVPDDIVLKTHEGAARTMLDIIQTGTPKGVDGAVHVILNNPKYTEFYEDEQGEDVRSSGPAKVDPDYKIFKIADKVETDYFVIKDFMYLTLKEEGEPFKTSRRLKRDLYQWIKENVPKTVDLWRRMKN